MSGTTVESTEHFIIFQTKNLNSDDQSFHTTHEQVTEYNDNPVRITLFDTGKHQYNFHHCSMTDSESTDTDKGQGVGEVAEQCLK